MRPEEAEKSLRQLLKSSGKTLKALSAEDLLQFATASWLETTVEGVRPEFGDGLVAYFELMDRGRGTVYEFGVNRIMSLPPEKDGFSAWVPAFKLRISVAFKTTLQVFQLNPVVSSFACWDKQKTKGFIEEIQASPQFKLVSTYTQHSSGIACAECNAPRGAPVHPLQGLTWAIS
jgi:hypothetical protein